MTTQWITEALRRFGQTVTVRQGDTELSVQAFLQPVTGNKEAQPLPMTELGAVDDRMWLYLGQQELGSSDTVEQAGKKFRVRSCRPYYVGQTLSHWWAVLTPEQEMTE